MPTIRANGIEIYYTEQGRGRPVVMMAGVGQWHAFWWRNVPALSEHFRVITFDNRGVGDSDKPDIPYDVAMQVDDLLGLIDGLGLDRPHLVGHSMGAGVSLELAMSRPERVDRLVFMSGIYPGPDYVPFTPEAAKLLFDPSGEPLERFNRGVQAATASGFAERDDEAVQKMLWLRTHSQQTPALWQRQSRAGLSYVTEDHLRPIPNPILLLYGSEDGVAPPENGRRIAAKMPNARLALVPDAGHWLPVEQPAEVNRRIIEFLRPA